MKTPLRIVIVLLIAAAVAGVVVLKKNKAQPSASAPGPAAAVTSTTAAPAGPIPRLLDLGAGKCIPCKMMAPILEELKRDYAGKMTVEFIDVWQNPQAGEKYGIQMIPTQIFYDASGKERFRHTGFFGKDDILAKWKELGVNLGGQPVQAPQETHAIAYYFHGTIRCETCLKIEKLAKAVIEEKFAPQLAAKQLAFLSVNYELPENKHFSDDYKLPSPSLVLVRRQSGQKEKWKLLGDTWDLAHEPDKLKAYVTSEVSQFLPGKP